MKTNQLMALSGLLAACLALGNSFVGSKNIAASGLPNAAQREAAASGSQLRTLYAHDDLLSSFNFRDDAPGGRVRDGELDLSRAQLVFHRFAADQLSYGFVRNEAVSVIDLGEIFVPGFASAGDLAPKFDLSIFHSLFLDGIKVSYVGAGGRLLRLKQAQRIFDPPPREGLHHIQPVIGHTYLMRVVPRGGDDELFKFEVVDFQPEHSVVLRWAPLPRH